MDSLIAGLMTGLALVFQPMPFFYCLLGVVLGIALIVMEPPATLFLLLSGYVAFGFLRFMMPERVHSLFARFGESKKPSP